MIKLACLFVALCAATSMTTGELVVAPIVPDAARSKVFIEKPVLLEVNHADDDAAKLRQDTSNNNKNQDEIPVAQPVDAAPKSADSSLPSAHLDPIPLMMMPQLPFGIPQFMQQIMNSLNTMNMSPMNNDAAASDAAANSGDASSSQSSEESGMNSGMRHGSLTILLMKSQKLGDTDKSVSPIGQDNADGAAQQPPKRIILYKFMPKFRFGGKGDPDSDPNFMNSLNSGNSDDNTKKSVHLLGGDHDLKRFDFMKDPPHLLGSDDFDVDRIRNQNPLIGGDESKIENFFPLTPLEVAEDDSTYFAKFKNFLNGIGKTDNNNFDPEFMRHHQEHGDEQHKPGKKCMMMSFMRFKSSLYFRTVLHLLFFTGLLMILLCLTMLTIRNIKRRRALRYYNKNLNVATIEGSQTKEEEAHSARCLFRFGFGKSGAKNPLVSNSFLVQAPPAYDQISIGGDEKHEEKQASKAKFSKLTNEEDETKSLSTLPAYEQAVSAEESEDDLEKRRHHHHHHHHPHPHHHHHHHHPHPHPHEEEK
jgi:hypothetical protein